MIKKDLVKKITALVKIPVSKEEEETLTKGFIKTIETINNLFEIDIKDISPIHQVTFLENVLRDDVVNEEKTLTQDQSLSQAKFKYKGYFVADFVFQE